MLPFHNKKFALLLSIATSFIWIGPRHHVAALSSGIQVSSSRSSTASPIPTIQAAPTLRFPQPRPIPSKLQEAWESNRHPVETQDEIGYGIFLTDDWRRAWFTYGQDTDESSTIVDPITGYANYIIDEIEGTRPVDLVGTLYRNGPGKMGVNGQRVAHALDGDGLVLQLVFEEGSGSAVTFQSKFVHTTAFQQELRENRFVSRGTFGTGPMGDAPGRGINEDPTEPSIWTKVKERALNVDIKNPANTQVVAFGGKLLALFEAGLPYRLNPDNLETMYEDDMGGVLPKGKIAVKCPTFHRRFFRTLLEEQLIPHILKYVREPDIWWDGIGPMSGTVSKLRSRNGLRRTSPRWPRGQ
ncbi:Retinal pigment epithelial membrane protein [Fragilaria crotonensis]|nr:Retinal pigment epithelial membrane protein [Fragilaria crotonensis]